MAFLTQEQLEGIGFASLGQHVLISDRASIYNPGAIRLGNRVRVDDYVVLSAGNGGIELGNYVHIAVFCSLLGQGRIVMEDFSGLSSRVSIYSSSDDYSGATLTNPTVPEVYKNVHHADVILRRHVIVGAGSVLLPGVELEEGVAIGALSLVNRNCKRFGIYSGTPAKRIAERDIGLLHKEQLLRSCSDSGG